MSSATTLLAQFTESDVDWLLESHETRHVAAGEIVILKDQPLTAIYLLLEGVLEVRTANDSRPNDILGPGEMVGEMSFVEDERPARTVAAVEASTLLVIPHDDLRQRAAADPAFAARLYRALALLLSRRLRHAGAAIAAQQGALFDDEGERTTWEQVTAGVERFKGVVHDAHQAALSNGGLPTTESASDLEREILRLYTAMQEAIGDDAPAAEQFKAQVGLRIQKEFVPYMLLTKVIARIYTKPRGYAGDYLTIAWMYDGQPGGVAPLGPLLDVCMLGFPPGVAVCNRRGLLVEEITRVLAAREGEVARVTSLACGPAREIFDAFEQLADPAGLAATVVDFDAEALSYVSERRDALGLQRSIDPRNENLIHLALGRSTIDVADQDLVYTIGLIDYFPDDLVVKLMTMAHGLLRVGGKVILGNFHSSNPAKAFMDHVLDWRLIHRTEADMDRLYRASAFARDCTNIRFEQQGINMFAECVKD